MKGLLTMIAAIYLSAGFAQCEYVRNEVDKFKGYRYTETTMEKLFGTVSESMSVAFTKIDSSYYITLQLTSVACFYISPDDDFLINYSGGTQMTLNRSSSSEIASAVGTTGIWSLTTSFVLNESELYQLQNKLITGVRLYHSKGAIEGSLIKEKAALKVKQVANCISSAPSL